MSKPNWPVVPLSKVVVPVHRTVTITPGISYRTLGVKWWGEGAYERQTIDGAQTAARTLNEVKEDDLIINKIWVRHGSVAIVGRDVAGCYGSNEFPTFEFRRELIEPRWMHWYSKSRELWTKCDLLSQGTSGKNRIRPEKFMTVEVPLPELKVQQRIVERIDSLVSKVEEAKQASKKVAAQSRLLAVSLAHRADLSRQEKDAMGWREVILGDVLCEEFDDHRVAPTQEYPNFGLYSYGRGLFVKAPISGMATSATRLRRVRAGQFIYSRLFAWEGAFGLVTPEFDGWFVSNEYPTFACNLSEVLPEFLPAYFQAKQAWDAVAVGSKGLGSRRQRVQPEQLLAHRLMLPPMHVQIQLKKLNSFVPEIEETRSKLRIEIDAMLPSILDSAFKGAL